MVDDHPKFLINPAVPLLASPGRGDVIVVVVALGLVFSLAQIPGVGSTARTTAT